MRTLSIESNGRLDKTAVYINAEQVGKIKELFLNLDENGTFDAILTYENKNGTISTKQLFTDYLDDVSTEYIDPTIYANYFTGAKLTNALLLNDRQYELNPGHVTTSGDQRGNASNNDAYFTFNLKIGYVFGREKIK